MKKTLIALAVLGAVGAAQAQSNVTIYGQFNPSYDFVTVKDSSASGDTKYVHMSDNSSRIGFKGTEDLGGGLKAIFQAEAYFDIVTKAGFDGARDAFAGLQGGFGTVRAGAFDPVYKRITASYDPFGDTISDYNSIMGVSDNGVDLNKRYANVLGYISPNMSGFQAMVDYAWDKVDDDAAAGKTESRKLDLGVTYTNGPLNVLAAYTVQKNTTLGADDEDIKGMKIGAAYTLPTKTTIRAIVENMKQDGKVDQNKFLIGAEHPIGNVDLLANFIMAGKNDEAAVSDDTGAKALNLGARYNFSKRTNLMAMYTYLKNDDNAMFGSDAGYVGTVGGSTVSGLSVRLQHKF